MKYVLLIVVAVTLLVGCQTTSSFGGPKIAQEDANFIQKGVTTRAEVERKFGPPGSIQILPDGKRMALYNHYETTGPGVFLGFANIKSETSTVQIVYNAQNIVIDYDTQTSTGTTAISPFSGIRQVNN